MKPFASLIIVCSLFAAPVAFAGDKPLLPPPEAKPAKTPYNWTGAYVGGTLGTNRSGAEWRDSAPSAPSRSFFSTPSFGAHAGYNYQFGSGLLPGGETDVSHRP